MQRTGLTFMMPKISTVVLKTSYWYTVGFKCDDVSTCCEDVIFQDFKNILFYYYCYYVFIYCIFTFFIFFLISVLIFVFCTVV